MFRSWIFGAIGSSVAPKPRGGPGQITSGHDTGYWVPLQNSLLLQLIKSATKCQTCRPTKSVAGAEHASKAWASDVGMNVANVADVSGV